MRSDTPAASAWTHDSPNRAYIPAVDHLRAGFAMLILLYHGWHVLWYRMTFGQPFQAQPWPIVENPLLAFILEGHTAVGAFMVLSGFIFVHGTQNTPIAYWPFLRNRLLRIYPMYLVVLVLGASLTPQLDLAGGILRYVLPTANYGPVLFGVAPVMAWAVAVEFQFYLVFPLLHTLMRRHGGGLLMRMLLLAVILRLLLTLGGQDVTLLSYLTIAGRIDQFLLGMAAGYWLPWLTHRVSHLRWHVVPAALLILAGSYAFHRAGGWPNTAWWRALWPTAEGAAWSWFIVAYVAFGPSVPALLSRALCWVGQISFSLYLLHMLVIEAIAVRQWMPLMTNNAYVDALLVTIVIVVPASLALAAFAYRVIEVPFLGLRRRYTGGNAAGTSG